MTESYKERFYINTYHNFVSYVTRKYVFGCLYQILFHFDTLCIKIFNFDSIFV